MTVMASKSLDAQGKSRPRTAESVVWNGIKARDFESSNRCVWDKYQEVLYLSFLRTVGLNFKNCDITPLLIQLNLDGYDGVKNGYGEDVHALLEVKVRWKLRNMADTIGIEGLSRISSRMQEATASSQTKIPESAEVKTTKTNQVPPKQSSKQSSKQQLEASMSKLSISAQGSQTHLADPKLTPSRPVHPLLKMPKGTSSQDSSAHIVTVKCEPADSEFTFGIGLPLFPINGSRERPATKTEEGACPPMIFKGLLDSPTPARSHDKPADGVVDQEKDIRDSAHRRTVAHLCQGLRALKMTLGDIGPALDAAKTTAAGDAQWEDALTGIAQLVSDMKSEVDYVEGLAEERK
ncbi:hypothetical protein GGR56DRAFT_468000 [Xylariaceae sp. FL0804]|nr:hypothetical protein GGR56DRAFT_468000 [Xylariaceae sp. FL0804]